MSCNTCDKSFGLITREKACPNCGFSYCSACLRFKQFVAKLNQNVKVCGPCNRVLSNPMAKEAPPRSPPSALKKRLERLHSLPDAKHPVTVYKVGEIAKLRFGLPLEDQEIAERLEKLKSPPVKMDDQTEDQINQRLNKLRGVDENQVPKTYQQTTVIHADDLLAQMEEQIAIEKDLPDPNTEIEERLAKLRGVDVDQVRNPGRGLDNKPPGRSVTTIKVEPEMLLHDHSSYTMPTDEDDESLSKDISDINQEKTHPTSSSITFVNLTPSDANRMDLLVEEDPHTENYGHEGGIIHPVYNNLTCKICSNSFKNRVGYLLHQKQDNCLNYCLWKEDFSGIDRDEEAHEHSFINIAFATEEDAIHYAIENFDVESLFNKTSSRHGKSRFSTHTHFNCKQGSKPFYCQASLRIRPSRRFVSNTTIVQVYELIGCVKHNHELEFRPCLIKHTHEIIDELYNTFQEAEERLTALSQRYSYRRSDNKDGRIYLKCKKKGQEKGSLCPAHIHIVQLTLSDGLTKVRVKGCVAHCHPPMKKNIICEYEHEHQVIDMTFKDMAEFQNYLEESELDAQFSKHTGGANGASKTKCHRYICTKHNFWKNRYKRKKKIMEYYECPAMMYLNEPIQSKCGKQPIHLTGCLTHNHEVSKTKFSVKFRREVSRQMELLNMTKEQKFRNFRRFRDLVLEMKKKMGDSFLDEFSVEDVNVSRDLISFKEHFMLRYPQAANSALLNSKSFQAVLKARRELKKKRLLEKLRYVHTLVEQMELNEDTEDYMDKTVGALKIIPGLNEAFSKRKQPLEEAEPLHSVITTTGNINVTFESGPPAPKRRKKATNKKAVQEQQPIHQPIVTLPPEPPGQEDVEEYYVTDDAFPYIVTRSDGEQITTFNVEPVNNTMITFR